jgi:trehalose/maltose hydrolase-like predicted phosphorylase
VRGLVETLCAQCVDVVVVSGTHVGNVDGQLRARPNGPGRLLLALNRGSELFEVGAEGPHLIGSRAATDAEDAALTRAAELTVERLAARGLGTRVVSRRLNRRKIDLIPLAEWADPPKAQIGELLKAVTRRLDSAGIDGLPEVAAIAATAARAAGLPDPKITSDAKHVEIGLTDKGDSARAVFRELRRDGIAAALVLVAGDEFGDLGRMPGSDSLMLVPETAGATVCSVGIEPNGVPPGVVHEPGGPARFVELLEDQLRRRADVPRVAEEAGWSLVAEGVDRETERAVDAMFTIADGTIGTSGAPLLDHPDARSEVLAGGVYDGTGPASDLLTGPGWTALGRGLGSRDDVRRTLDLRTGTLAERVRGDTDLDSIRFCSLADPGLAVLRADVSPEVSAEPLSAGGATTTAGVMGSWPWRAARGSNGSVTAAAAQTIAGRRVERLVAYDVSVGGEPSPERACARVDDAGGKGFERLLREHRRAWARRWEQADVVVEGDDELQLRVRVALYHLMASAGERGESAVGARGLTGHAYRGHVFWDADLFVLPFLAATNPAAARSMLEYRVRRLPAALETARAGGRAGARFPWESAATGADVTPTAGRDRTGRVVPIRNGLDEIHIVGEVAWAACCYAGWTGDEQFERGPGLRLLVETARYWASRVHVDRSGPAHLYGVIGPDEYHEPVDDNAFTNVLARWNLRTAAAWAEAADDQSVSGAERARWRSVADALVDGLDPATGVYEQFAGFNRLEPLRIVDVAPRRPITADLLLGRDRVRRAQIVKQADVLMLHHLLPGEAAPGSLEANLDFYEPRTAHGSSLSPGIHASLFARAGRIDSALDNLRMAAAVDLDDLTHTAGGGVHLATMGSVWQALAFGFVGLRPLGGTLSVDPRLPDSWRALELGLRFRGAAIRMRMEPGLVSVMSDAPVVLEIGERQVACEAGRTEIPYEVSGGSR